MSTGCSGRTVVCSELLLCEWAEGKSSHGACVIVLIVVVITIEKEGPNVGLVSVEFAKWAIWHTMG